VGAELLMCDRPYSALFPASGLMIKDLLAVLALPGIEIIRAGAGYSGLNSPDTVKI
jgi:hypothetical protein